MGYSIRICQEENSFMVKCQVIQINKEIGQTYLSTDQEIDDKKILLRL